MQEGPAWSIKNIFIKNLFLAQGTNKNVLNLDPRIFQVKTESQLKISHDSGRQFDATAHVQV